MPLLAIDCGDTACSVAIQTGSSLFELVSEGSRQQSRELLKLIDALLDQANLHKPDIDGICWAEGPGSFTSGRIVAAAVQALSYALDIPVYSFSSLLHKVVAFQREQPDWSGNLAVAKDARMGQIYWATFHLGDGPGVMPQRLEIDSLCTPDSLNNLHQLDLIIGSASHLCVDWVTQCYAGLDPLARDLLTLHGLGSVNGKAGSAFEVAPLYLRDESAWKKLETR